MRPHIAATILTATAVALGIGTVARFEAKNDETSRLQAQVELLSTCLADSEAFLRQVLARHVALAALAEARTPEQIKAATEGLERVPLPEYGAYIERTGRCQTR